MIWTWKYAEMGGYDCMTDAIDFYLGTRRVMDMDMSTFGQERCRPPPEEGLKEAKALAQKIVDALNAQS